ncbi:ROK family transcriptional regulator [Alicyclobacillus fastidiosus]|uniref:ROK family transcriptional regulator n=1 Tax=Alicyclobacillus fastidiosus TaxID=392011 RepID=A0ABY6ZLH2_9BACL|nr:ROK family transcriptional regulator [Alicyclobacillus fastidiosus]WAH42944.1 ROK family transcriptional regulator [Alicyclobacillus fastidiosus]GMA64902.1 xylose repressor [Alicyclobacillus fastidiosus]
MTRTGDQSYIKNLNRSIVLNLLRYQGPLSRVEIARRTGLTKATISSIVDELISEKYVSELGHVSSSGVGRRAVLLEFNPAVGSVIGVELGVDFIKVLLLDLSARVIKITESSIQETQNPEYAVGQMSEMVKSAIADAPDSPLGVIGVGIGIPGLVDAKRGVVLNAPNLRWKDVHLKSLLQYQLGLPVVLDNEANAGAMGEQLFGAGKGVSNMVYLSIGTGIGTGIILNNQLIRGEGGIAGEFGHMTIDRSGPKCSCGNHGCLETYASEKAMLDRYEQLAGTRKSLSEITRLAQSGDASATAAIQSAASYLGIGIASLVNGLNPALILIGSRVGPASHLIIDTVDETVRDRSFTEPYSPTRIQNSALGDLTCAIGAASLVLHDHFSGPAA